jgi:hypothetical protein
MNNSSIEIDPNSGANGEFIPLFFDIAVLLPAHIHTKQLLGKY